MTVKNPLSKIVLLVFASMPVLQACKPAINPEQLYGKWRYTKIDHPNGNPADSTSTEELAINTPFIELKKPDTLRINWGHRVLSHGTFVLDGNEINFTELMSNGKTRTFPFVIAKLTDKEIVFETKGEEGSRVTAVR